MCFRWSYFFFALVCFSCNFLQFQCLFSNLCDITLIPLLLGFFFSGVFRTFSPESISDPHKHKQMPKLLWKFVLTSPPLTLPFFSPSLSPHLFALITTKPCHHGSCGHVNQPRPASSVPSCLPPAKQRSLSFCCRWGGVLRRLRAVIQQHTPLSAPPSLKRPVQHRESME